MRNLRGRLVSSERSDRLLQARDGVLVADSLGLCLLLRSPGSDSGMKTRFVLHVDVVCGSELTFLFVFSARCRKTRLALAFCCSHLLARRCSYSSSSFPHAHVSRARLAVSISPTRPNRSLRSHSTQAADAISPAISTSGAGNPTRLGRPSMWSLVSTIGGCGEVD